MNLATLICSGLIGHYWPCGSEIIPMQSSVVFETGRTMTSQTICQAGWYVTYVKATGKIMCAHELKEPEK